MTDNAPKVIEWGSLAVSEEEGMDVIRRAYGWTLGADGTVFGLVAGDMGFDATHITIPKEHLEAFCDAHAADEIEALRAEVERKNAALLQISTGRDRDGMKVDFFADIARAALADTTGRE